MSGHDDLRRARRVFWSCFVLTTVAATWLWDQTTGAAVVSGRLSPTLTLTAGLVALLGALVLGRMVWRLSGCGAKVARQ